jgi:hypothetical protein
MLKQISSTDLKLVTGGDQTFQYLCSKPGPNGDHIDRVTFRCPFSRPDHSPCVGKGMGVVEQVSVRPEPAEAPYRA